MSKRFEQLLRLAADYRRFCEEDGAVGRNSRQSDSDELCEEELFLVAAAAKMPENPDLPDSPLAKK